MQEEKLLQLINSWQEDNIRLAFVLAKELGIDLESIVQEKYGVLIDGLSKSDSSLPIKVKLMKHISLFKDKGYERMEFAHISHFPEIFKEFKVRRLYIWYAGFTTFPKTICYLSYLEGLHISALKMTEIPEEISKLTKLNFLQLRACYELITLPESIAKLSNLKTLRIRNARNLNSLPKEMGNLSSLKELDISNTKITELPPTFSKLENLQKLNVSGTQITNLPKDFTKKKLEIIQ